MPERNIVTREIKSGLDILHEGAWWTVLEIHCPSGATYARLSLVPFGRTKEIPLSIRQNSSQVVLVRDPVDTSHLHFCSAIEMMADLKVMIEEYDMANNLPDKVKLEGCNFQIESIIIRRQAHEAMMAKFNQLSNELKLVKKP